MHVSIERGATCRQNGNVVSIGYSILVPVEPCLNIMFSTDYYYIIRINSASVSNLKHSP